MVILPREDIFHSTFLVESFQIELQNRKKGWMFYDDLNGGGQEEKLEGFSEDCGIIHFVLIKFDRE